jgi:D-sedoheptulose 7-phosphate isomerase
MACGNGGSAADSQHFAAELLNRFEKERPPASQPMALTTDTSTLTSIANDYDYDAGILQAGARAGAPRTTYFWPSRPAGNSPNVVEAIARCSRARTARGRADGQGRRQPRRLLLRGQGCAHLCVPSDRTARIQEVHLLVLHCLCDGIDCMLLGADE